jgi:hypothetical protein
MFTCRSKIYENSWYSAGAQNILSRYYLFFNWSATA